jgi:ABC-type polysaccharide/polyol phosphate export permease
MFKRFFMPNRYKSGRIEFVATIVIMEVIWIVAIHVGDRISHVQWVQSLYVLPAFLLIMWVSFCAVGRRLMDLGEPLSNALQVFVPFLNVYFLARLAAQAARDLALDAE